MLLVRKAENYGYPFSLHNERAIRWTAPMPRYQLDDCRFSPLHSGEI